MCVLITTVVVQNVFMNSTIRETNINEHMQHTHIYKHTFILTHTHIYTYTQVHTNKGIYVNLPGLPASSIFLTTSIPSKTLPKTTCFPIIYSYICIYRYIHMIILCKTSIPSQTSLKTTCLFTSNIRTNDDIH